MPRPSAGAEPPTETCIRLLHARLLALEAFVVHVDSDVTDTGAFTVDKVTDDATDPETGSEEGEVRIDIPSMPDWGPRPSNPWVVLVDTPHTNDEGSETDSSARSAPFFA